MFLLKRFQVLIIGVMLIFVIASSASALPMGGVFRRGYQFLDDLVRVAWQKSDDVVMAGVKNPENLASLAAKYGDDVAEVLAKYGDEAARFVSTYGEEGLNLLKNYGDDVFTLSSRNQHRLLRLQKQYSPSVIRTALAKGDNGIKRLARYGAKVITGEGQYSNKLKKGVDGVIEFIKKHPVFSGLSASCIWFRDEIFKDGPIVVKTGIFLIGGLFIFVLTGFLASLVSFAMREWICVAHEIKGTLGKN